MSTWTRHGLSFTSTPSIPPKEHLDVLVLNGSPINGFFIDLRIKLNSPSDGVQLSLKELDWGFGGTRFEGEKEMVEGEGEGVGVGGEGGRKSRRSSCKWSTTICTRTRVGDQILLDEGNLFFDADEVDEEEEDEKGIKSSIGRNGTTFYERGEMINPINGIGEPGEEIWNSKFINSSGREGRGRERLIFMERKDGGALIGLVGYNSLGVGRNYKVEIPVDSNKSAESEGIFIWRRNQSKKDGREEVKLIYRLGEVEGIDLIEKFELDLINKKELNESEWIVGNLIKDIRGIEWIIREVN